MNKKIKWKKLLISPFRNWDWANDWISHGFEEPPIWLKETALKQKKVLIEMLGKCAEILEKCALRYEAIQIKKLQNAIREFEINE